MKILTVLGARPQFIKGAVLSREFQLESNSIIETIVHTGQHYDVKMSDIFFEELSIPSPTYNLNINGGGHASMTGKMLQGLESIVEKESPDCLLIYGDTNSTLAGALVAIKLGIPIAHVEAGLRSYNMKMPEEINRVISDRVSSFLFCPTVEAVSNLEKEGIVENVYNVGDVMYDAALFYRKKGIKTSNIVSELELKEKKFALVTCHRQENTDDKVKLQNIFNALSEIASTTEVVFPLHPRTRQKAVEYDILQTLSSKIKLIEPLSFLDMICLENFASIILTDSGGVQKEAYFYGVPCVTIRDQTEWVETLLVGANMLCNADENEIKSAYQLMMQNRSVIDFSHKFYGNGCSATKIVTILEKNDP